MKRPVLSIGLGRIGPCAQMKPAECARSLGDITYAIVGHDAATVTPLATNHFVARARKSAQVLPFSSEAAAAVMAGVAV